MPPDSLGTSAAVTPAAPAASLLERTLGPDWRCLPDAVIRAGGEAGPIDLAALHPRLGVVLVAYLDEDEAADPEDAIAAFHIMLEELAFARRYPGQLNVAAVTLRPNRRARLAEAIRAAAGDAPETPAAAGWIDWLAARLAEPLQEAALPRLVAPLRDDEDEEPRRAADTRLTGPRERLVLAEEPAGPRRHWLFQAALGLIVLAPVLAAIYVRVIG